MGSRGPFDPQNVRSPGQIGGAAERLGAEMDELSHLAIGAAIEVHRELGPGLPESVYEEALSIELAERGVAFTRQAPFTVTYKNQPVGHGRLDLLLADRLILELKAVETLGPVHVAQAAGYLRATGLRLALLINFNVRRLKDGIKRVVL